MRLPRTFLLYVCLGLALLATRDAGAQTIPVARADVNRDCTVTSADATIVQRLLGKRTGQAGFDANADVDQNGVINNTDLTFVTRNVGKNVCVQPPAAPTIAAAVAPAPNARGWHNTDVTITFTCTNATSCPAPVTVTAEGANQVITRTVSNSAGVTATRTVTLNIDRTPPALTAPVPASISPTGSVAIPVTAVDLSGLARASLQVRRAIAATTTAAPFSLTWAVPAGTPVGTVETLEVIGEDVAGNAAALRRTIAIDAPDTTPPTLAMRAPATAGPGAQVPLTLQGSDDRGLARVLVTRGGAGGTGTVEDRTVGPFAFQAITTIPAGLVDGDVVRFTAVATDGAGNSTPATADVRVVTSVQATRLEVTVDPVVSPTFQSSGVVSGTIGRATTAEPPQAPPILAGLAPRSGGQGQVVDVTITGVNTIFGPTSQVTFGPGVTVQSATATTPTSLTARIAIDAAAGIGPRLVAVSTGRSEAILPAAFSVVAGAGSVSGRVVTPAATPIANATVCRTDAASCVNAGGDGRFVFGGVPADQKRLLVSAVGFDPASLAVALKPNLATTVGDVTLTPTVQPPPPPPANAPAIAPALATVLGRGATDIGPGGNPEQLQKLFRDAVIAVGGKEIGVLDASGGQLNPRMVGAGVASFTNQAVEEIGYDMVTGDTMSFAKLFQIYIGSLKYPDTVPLPTLQQLIDGWQEQVDLAWANPGNPEAPFVMLMFNQGRVPSATPPRVSFDTQFNALQINIMTAAYMAFVDKFLPERVPAPGTQAALLPPPSPARVARGASWGDRLRGLASVLLPSPGPLVALRPGVAWTPMVPGFERASRRPRDPWAPPVAQQIATGTVAGRDGPGSWVWEAVVSKVAPSGGWTVAKNGGSLCQDFLVQAATDQGFQSVDGKSPAGQKLAEEPYAKFVSTPNCKTVIELIELLATSGKNTYLDASKTFTKFFGSEKATAASAARLQQMYGSASYQAAWTAAKEEARKVALTNGVLKIGAGLVEGSLSKMQGAVVDQILKLETQLVIDSVRPRQPFIKKIEQQVNPETTPASPSRLVKITVTRSPNDKGVYDNPEIRWTYQLYRGRAGAVEPVIGKHFPPTEEELVFVDEVPNDGTWVYAVRALRVIGYPLTAEPVQNTFVDKMLGFFGSFASTAVKIGDRAGAFSLDSVKILLNPMADVFKGVRLQYSILSDPEQIYVSTAPPVARPPASLTVSPLTGQAFLNVPAFDRIFKVGPSGVEPYTQVGFKAPGAVGLASDFMGDLYTDNAASDALYGGRVFTFKNFTGTRVLAGTVNYFSQLLMFANPVSVQAMVVANGPFGEQLFIADALNQRITNMTLPRQVPAGADRNVSQTYAQSPLLNFGPGAALAMRDDYMLVATTGNNVALVQPTGQVFPLFDANNNAPSPFTSLTGVTFDRYGNMYVSDQSLGTIVQVPRSKTYPSNGLRGVDAIGIKKLTVKRGLRRPVDIKLNGDRNGLVYYDGERAYAGLLFGMTGQVLDASGAPLAGADIWVPDRQLRATTDADGIYVLPNLVGNGVSPILDFQVRARGRTVSYRKILDLYTHNVVDVTFDPPTIPPPPPPPPGERPEPLPPDPPAITSSEQTVTARFEYSGTPTPGPNTCPRAAFLAPAAGIGTANPSVTVSGLISNRRFSSTVTLASVILTVNGTATTVPLTGEYDFTTTAALRLGENVMTIALPASVLKPIGCADPSLADTAAVAISPTHRVFHDTRPAEITTYRQAAGFDVGVRAIVREAGLPLAGLTWVIPGTRFEATTDADGIFQINLPKAELAGQAGAADQVGTALFQQIGSIVALLRADRRAESLAALDNLLVQAMGTQDAPPPAASTTDALLARIVQVEGTARKLVVALESTDGIPDAADIDALEALGQRVAALRANGQVVIRSREYPNVSFTVSVQ